MASWQLLWGARECRPQWVQWSWDELHAASGLRSMEDAAWTRLASCLYPACCCARCSVWIVALVVVLLHALDVLVHHCRR
jgi:hypothetical protein